MNTSYLPIFEIKERVESLIEKVPLVVTAPTGSGKSTELPRWLCRYGKVLVIEPRRVACLGLAGRVSFLDQTPVGKKVGYRVRGERKYGDDTQILFVTPGIALRYFSSGRITDFSTVILDEFHERSQETDLLVALLKKQFKGKLLVTSATIDAVPLAKYLGAECLHAKGTLFPVEVNYLSAPDALPSSETLVKNVTDAVSKAKEYPGDILVFLPGKAQIQWVFEQLTSDPHVSAAFDVMKMHGALGLTEQEKVFSQTNKRKLVLATNVCETSITVPGIGVVIDSGLVKRTRFVNDRGFLTMMPIAYDSAEQRKGRAGRTAKGVCFRLWSQRAVLEKYTPAEIFRQSLTGLALAAASCGESLESLDFYESPKPYAVETATAELIALGAVDETCSITSRGHALFGLPLKADMAALLVDAEKEGLLAEAIDLVSVAESGRELFSAQYRSLEPEDDIRRFGCDIRSSLLALQCDRSSLKKKGIHLAAFQDAKKLQKELQSAFGVPLSAKRDVTRIPQLIQAFIQTNPKSAYVARRKRGKLFFGNGDGKEIVLSTSSAVDEKNVEAIVVFSSMAAGLGYRDKDAKIIATMASPVKLQRFAAAQLGDISVLNPKVKKGKIVAVVERVYAGCVLESKEEVPTGSAAREAVAQLFLRGSIFSKQCKETKERLADASLIKKVMANNLCDEPLPLGDWEGEVPSIERWIVVQLEEIGIDSGADFALLSESDFLAPALPDWTAQWLHSHFAQQVNLGDVQYNVLYDFSKRTVILQKNGGTRKTPPSLNTVPGFTGFKIKVKHNSQTWVLRP